MIAAEKPNYPIRRMCGWAGVSESVHLEVPRVDGHQL